MAAATLKLIMKLWLLSCLLFGTTLSATFADETNALAASICEDPSSAEFILKSIKIGPSDYVLKIRTCSYLQKLNQKKRERICNRIPKSKINVCNIPVARDGCPFTCGSTDCNSAIPIQKPNMIPSLIPSTIPSKKPMKLATNPPSLHPTLTESFASKSPNPTARPSHLPTTTIPTKPPSSEPTPIPSDSPSIAPSVPSTISPECITEVSSMNVPEFSSFDSYISGKPCTFDNQGLSCDFKKDGGIFLNDYASACSGQSGTTLLLDVDTSNCGDCVQPKATHLSLPMCMGMSCSTITYAQFQKSLLESNCENPGCSSVTISVYSLGPISPTTAPPTIHKTLLPTAVPSISPFPTSSPSSLPSLSPTINGCETKRISITHICNIPDLDPKSGDSEMDIKIFVQDDLYWPQNVVNDCDYGSYSKACKIPDGLITNKCFQLKNSIELLYRSKPTADMLKITIYDEDTFLDDSFDISIPTDDWFDRQQCEERSFDVPSTKNLAHFVMTVRSEPKYPTMAPTRYTTEVPTLSNIPTSIPTRFPSVSPSEAGCRRKRLTITHICNLPDLDDVFLDSTMEIKVLVQNKIYWPQNAEEDCDTGIYAEACEISDYKLMQACYPLKNSIELVFNSKPPTELFQITIYDVDMGTDERIDIYIPTADWYDRQHCGLNTFDVQSKTSTAHIKMSVFSEETFPTPKPSERPSNFPSSSQSPTNRCGLDFDLLPVGLQASSNALEEVSASLASFATLGEGSGRRLLWKALSSLTMSFKKSYIGRSMLQEGPISSLADFCTIAGALSSGLDFFGLGVGAWKDEPDPMSQYFEKILDKLDVIENKLDNIEERIEEGFNQLTNIIYFQDAKNILDDLLHVQLAGLRSDYRFYLLNSGTSVAASYEQIFRTSCQMEHSPFDIFAGLYGHSCRECDKFNNQRFTYLLDTFVDIAIDEFAEPKDRILWFRQAFSTIIIGAMVETIYLHSVCLYTDNADSCPLDNLARSQILEEMGEALVEVGGALSNAEERLKCRRKLVKITHICDLPDMDPAILQDNDMDIQVEIDDEIYWPQDSSICGGTFHGNFVNSCVIPDELLMNKCFKLSKSQQWAYDEPKELEITIRDVDVGTDETIRFKADSSIWHDPMVCDEFSFELVDNDRFYVDGLYKGHFYTQVKVTVESALIEEKWNI